MGRGLWFYIPHHICIYPKDKSWGIRRSIEKMSHVSYEIQTSTIWSVSYIIKWLEACKDSKVQQDESYLSSGNLPTLNRFSTRVQMSTVSQLQMQFQI